MKFDFEIDILEDDIFKKINISATNVELLKEIIEDKNVMSVSFVYEPVDIYGQSYEGGGFITVDLDRHNEYKHIADTFEEMIYQQIEYIRDYYRKEYNMQKENYIWFRDNF